MQRIAFDIDPLAFVRNQLNLPELDPVSAVVLAELGGAESIVCYLRDDLATSKPRDIKLLKELVKTHFTVRTNLTEENIRNLIALKVDMISFVAPGSKSDLEPQTISLPTYGDKLADYIAELRSNNILSSVLIEPTISEMKLAGKLGFDYVELDVSSLAHVDDYDTEREILENIASLAFAASKLGLSTNISGSIGYDNVKDIAAIDYIEDIIIGKPIIPKAISIGIEQAIRDLQAMIN